jgi:nitroimidazol reductase NimA-like FMN-containing flavoprotein (pyridoxamine 5'-phosphate oxidase superfamily)
MVVRHLMAGDLKGTQPMSPEKVTAVLDDPVPQRLITSAIPARLAYVGADAYPRVIPIGFVYDGKRFVVFTSPNAAKIAFLEANPKVALTIDTESQPPNALLVRGTAQLSKIDGVPDQFVEAARKIVPPENFEAWEAGVRALYTEMVRIDITPTWAKVLDFETRIPSAVEELVQQRQAERTRVRRNHRNRANGGPPQVSVGFGRATVRNPDQVGRDGAVRQASAGAWCRGRDPSASSGERIARRRSRLPTARRQ